MEENYLHPAFFVLVKHDTKARKSRRPLLSRAGPTRLSDGNSHDER